MPGYDRFPREQRHDLTNLPNRLALGEYLGWAIKKMPANFALLELDIDNLKDTNDRYGHAKGDALLQSAAMVLDNGLRKTDLFLSALPVHKSGDEFSVILAGIRSDEDVASVRERLRDLLAKQKIGTAIGGRMHQYGETAEQLTIAADDLMTQDKKRRKKEQYNTLQARRAVSAIGRFAARAGIARRDLPYLLEMSENGEF